MQWSSYQNNIFNQASDMVTSFHIEAKAGSGKCLGFDTKVVKFNGELEKVQNIKTGDLLMGDDGTPRKVLSTSKGFGKMYKIYPVKGDSFVCNDVHVLTLTGTNSFNGTVIDIPLNEYLALCEQRSSFKKDWKLFRVGVDFVSNPESIKYDPWLIGIWLAEGSVNEACISNPDIEIWQECEKIAKEIGLKITYLLSGDKCPRLSFTGSGGKHTNAFRQYVRSELFRDGEKVIPHEYLIASRSDRLRLLAGLLDGDGYYDPKKKGYEIITQYFSLCSSILFLARSLGFTANWSVKKVKLEGWADARDYFRINISGNCETIPCVVKRKQAEPRLQIKRHNVTGFSAVQIADGNYYGFTLDGNGRFLLEDFTVTHNTTVMTEIANQSGLGEKFLFVAFSKLIADTLKKKLPNNHCSTLHSLGYSVLRKRVPGNIRWTVDGYKYLKTLQAHLEPIQQKKGKKTNASHIKATEYQLLLQKAEDDYAHGAGLWMIAEVIGKMMVTLTPPNTNDIVNMADMYNVNLPLAPDEMAEVAARTIALGREAAFNGGFVDFNEMLYWPTMERWQVGSYHTVGIDEAQDLNNCQQQFLTLIRKERIISVGDKFQCQPAGTRIMAPVWDEKLGTSGQGWQTVDIEEIEPGDVIAGHSPRDGRVYGNKKVKRTSARPYKGKMISVRITDGWTSESHYTPNHKCYVKMDGLAGKTFLYLMRRGNQYRMGISEFQSKKYNGRHCLSRLRTEGADAVWILDAFESRREALVAEAIESHRFGIPQTCFSSEKLNIKDFAPRFWESVGDNTEKAKACLAAYGRLIEYPLFTNRTDIQQSVRRPEIVHACNLMQGMKFARVKPNRQISWCDADISEYEYDGIVYSLDVEDELYVADGIVTHNSIFMFAGARCDSVDNLRKLFGGGLESEDQDKWMQQLPLSVCYRCDKEIIRHAQRLVPDIEYHADKKEGVVREIKDEKLIENLESGAFILCRLNAPLVSKCFQLIIAGVAAKIRGKDVADQLISTIHHIAQSRTFDISNFSYHLDHYYDLEMGKIIRRGGRREKALLSMLADKVQCLQSFYDNVQPSSVYEMTDAVKALFKEGGNSKVTLMSVHKCVHPDTLVETENGLERIRNISEEGFIGTENGAESYVAKVTNPNSKALEITTKSGYQLTVTPEHGMMCFTPSGWKRKQAENLSVGDKLRLKIGSSIDNHGDALLNLQEPDLDIRAKGYTIPEQMTGLFAEFLGLFVADGTLFDRGFRLLKRHKDVVDKFQSLVYGLFNYDGQVAKSNHSNAYEFTANSVMLSKLLGQIDGLRPNEKAIPTCILNASVDEQAAFLRGLFEDGTVNQKDGKADHIHFETISPQIGKDVQIMLLRQGILCTRIERIGSRGFPITTIYIYGKSISTFRDKIGFISRFKSDRLLGMDLRDMNRRLFFTASETDEIWHSLNKHQRGNLHERGLLSRWTVEAVTPNNKMLNWHHEEISSIKEVECESVCVEVPNGSRFIQNGFDGWNSKGLEAPQVMIIEPNKLPLVFPNQSDEEMQQERNLTYVARTRAEHELIYVIKDSE